MSNDILRALEQEKVHACQAYIEEMQQEYGSANHWFRKRKRSVIVDNFIDSIREKTINAWNEKNQSEKNTILETLVHADSPINFWIIKVKKDLTLDILKYYSQSDFENMNKVIDKLTPKLKEGIIYYLNRFLNYLHFL